MDAPGARRRAGMARPCGGRPRRCCPPACAVPGLALTHFETGQRAAGSAWGEEDWRGRAVPQRAGPVFGGMSQRDITDDLAAMRSAPPTAGTLRQTSHPTLL
jgi:hypothetical protein